MTKAWFQLVICLSALVILLDQSECRGLTINIAGGQVEFVSVGDDWRYFKGTVAPPADWADVDFDDAAWSTGPSGFGYADSDDATELDDMEDGYLTLYIRKEFTVATAAEGLLDLVIDFDDGFVAYLNGVEVERDHMPGGAVTFETEASSHEAGSPETFLLGNAGDLLRVGTNVLAIEGHNTSLDSSDFSLIPALRTRSSIGREGDTWIVETGTVTLSGATSAAEATQVKVDGADAAFDAGSRSWSGEVTLSSGLNTIVVEALDADESVVDSGTIEILYIPASNHLGGSLTENTTWSGAYVVDETITVPTGVVLTIEAGTVIMIKESAGMRVEGQLLANGTEASPVRFTHYGEDTTWERMMFVDAEDSLLSHCIIEYSDCEGDHKDLYDTRDADCNPVGDRGPRDYFQAVVVVACHLDIDGCLFHKLPDDSAGAEGDAIAIISDDIEHPGDATANVMSSQFLDIGQGIHTRYSYVLVEDCYFTGHDGDNDDVDLYGESTPPPMIRNNLFLNPGHDDMINPTRCSAIIIGNVIAGCDDHGVVLRDKCKPIVMNNIIYDCRSAGISVQNQCEALIMNNVIYDCGRGIRLFDHTGRWGLPYCLFPGSGKATVINCIIADCPTPFDLSNSPTDDWDSQVTVMHSLIQGGREACDVGDESTLVWGEGNIDGDPMFVDPENGDFRLREGSPAIDAGTADQAPEDDFDGNPRPCGDGVDMGAFEYGGCGIVPGRFERADSNSDGSTDISDAVATLLFLFAGGREPLCHKAADADDDGKVEITDAIYTLRGLFMGGPVPPAPHGQCGLDPTDDGLTCVSYPPCE